MLLKMTVYICIYFMLLNLRLLVCSTVTVFIKVSCGLSRCDRRFKPVDEYILLALLMCYRVRQKTVFVSIL